MKCLAILGASGHGRVVAEIAKLSGWEKIVFFDDNISVLDKEFDLLELMGGTKELISKLNDIDDCFVAIGDNKIRSEKVKLLLTENANIVSLVHPSAKVSSCAYIEKGTVIMAGAIINPFVKIGLSSIINSGSIVDHDCICGDFVHISPGVNISGGVEIGKNTWIGIGSSLKQNIKIGENVIIGAGSVVVENIPSQSTAFGSPAKVQKN